MRTHFYHSVIKALQLMMLESAWSKWPSVQNDYPCVQSLRRLNKPTTAAYGRHVRTTRGSKPVLVQLGIAAGRRIRWEHPMKRTPLSIPEIGFIGGTRAAFGAGVALLLADRLNDDQRRAVGWTLLAVGALTTIPIVVQLVSSRHDDDEDPRRFGRSQAKEYAS
jgi:hypothetical protein